MTSSYPSATGRSHLPGHSAPSMATPGAGDENARLKENPNAQVDFIKTLPRKDVSFGAQAAMDRDRLPLVAKNEQYAISAGTSTATMLKEKQISTYDTQVAAHGHAPNVTSSSSTNTNIGSPSSSTRPHLIPDTVLNMANKAKEMIFGHKHETTTHTTTGAYPGLPITTPIPGVSMTSPPLPSSTIASRNEPTAKEKAEEMMGVVNLPGEKATPPLAKFNSTNTGPTTLDKIKTTIATDADKAKNALTSGTEKAKQTISSGTEKAKQMMSNEKAAISSGAHQLADKTKEMLGMDTANTKTVTKTSLKREDDLDTTLMAQQDFLEPALRKMSVDKTTDKNKSTFPMTGTNTAVLPLEKKPLETLVLQQDLLEPQLFVESAPVSRSSTNLAVEKTSTSKITEKPDLYGNKLDPGRHSPNLIDQIASDNPFSIGAEVEDQMAMFMASRYRSHK